MQLKRPFGLAAIDTDEFRIRFRARGDFDSPRPAAFARKPARCFCENRETRVFPTTEKNAETFEGRLADGKIDMRA